MWKCLVQLRLLEISTGQVFWVLYSFIPEEGAIDT